MKFTARLTTILVATSLCFADTLAAQGSAETNLMTNGSFESWAHYATEALPGLLKAGGTYDDAKDPLVPRRWSWRLAGTTTLTRSAEAHGGKAALVSGKPLVAISRAVVRFLRRFQRTWGT